MNRPTNWDKTYRPDADIAATYIGDNGEWYYFSTEVLGPIRPPRRSTPLSASRSILTGWPRRLLLWPRRLLPTWTNTDVQVYADTNRDVGNRRRCCWTLPPRSKAMAYETVVFATAPAPTPGAAWERQSPQNPNTLPDRGQEEPDQPDFLPVLGLDGLRPG